MSSEPEVTITVTGVACENVHLICDGSPPPPGSVIDIISDNNTDIVVAAPYRFDTNNGHYDTVTGRRDFFNLGHKSRIRQNGDAVQVQIPAGHGIVDPALTSFHVTVWREVGPNSYDLIAMSEDILPQLAAGGANKNTLVNLTTPLTGIKDGDFTGFTVDSTANVSQIVRIGDSSNNPESFTFDGGAGNAGFPWESQTPDSKYCSIQLYMQAPNIVSIGDSITAGHNTNYSFAEATMTNLLTTQVVRKVSEHFGWTYQNMGIGGGQAKSGSGLNRFQKDVVDSKPKAALIGHGTADVNADKTEAEYIANMRSMLQLCQNNNIIPIVLAIYPRTNFNDTKAATRRQFNNALVPLVAEFNGVLVNSDDALGQLRASTGELDDLVPAYTNDNIHLTEAGNAALADKIISVLEAA